MPTVPKLGAELDELSALLLRPGFGYSCVTQNLTGGLYTAGMGRVETRARMSTGRRPGAWWNARRDQRGSREHARVPGLSRSVDLTCLSNDDCDAGYRPGPGLHRSGMPRDAEKASTYAKRSERENVVCLRKYGFWKMPRSCGVLYFGPGPLASK
jgi:hypothetical protein